MLHLLLSFRMLSSRSTSSNQLGSSWLDRSTGRIDTSCFAGRRRPRSSCAWASCRRGRRLADMAVQRYLQNAVFHRYTSLLQRHRSSSTTRQQKSRFKRSSASSNKQSAHLQFLPSSSLLPLFSNVQIIGGGGPGRHLGCGIVPICTNDHFRVI